MLFPYKYVPHNFEKMQEYVDFIFYEIWCKAPKKEYGISLFDGDVELKKMIKELHYNDDKGAEFFLHGIQKIFELFQGFSEKEIRKMMKWYHINNDIEELCKNTKSFEPLMYEKLDCCRIEDLSKELKKFFTNIYSSSFLSIVPIRSRFGDLKESYNAFMKENKKGRCPFCGINLMKGIHHIKREAYDHFFPKSKFPFNSINFRNLVPMCHECNSSYKSVTNPIENSDRERRKVFYSFMEEIPDIDIKIQLNGTLEITYMEPSDIELNVSSEKYQEETATWQDIFGIQERYKALIVSESDGLCWVNKVLSESKNYGMTPADMFSAEVKTATENPFADNNFLKKPFLEACNEKGLFGD